MPKTKDESASATKAFAPRTDDEYSGQGGSYIYDPATGKRMRVEEPTAPATKE